MTAMLEFSYLFANAVGLTALAIGAAFFIHWAFNRACASIGDRLTNAILVIIMIGLSMLLLSGCGSVPYVDVGVGYKNPNDTWPDWGRNPTTSIEVGMEWIDSAAWCGYRHQSHLLDGKPFNANPESAMGAFECHKRWRFGVD